MYTEKEKRQLYTSEKSFCYAIGCDLLPQNMFDMIDDHITTLRQTAIDILKFELS